MMVYLFFDTSAVVKRYINENGSEWIKSQYRRTAENRIILSYATLTESVTAFCRKARQQDLNQRISEFDRNRCIKRFRRDVELRYSLVDVTKEIYVHAGDLCCIYKLRAYDAIQLACALKARNELVALGRTAPVFVSADTDLLSIAQAEGFDVENPNDH
jgi:hypothetical protein